VWSAGYNELHSPGAVERQDKMSAFASSEHVAMYRLGSDGPIVLQKSKVVGLRFFCENQKREAVADSCNFNRVTEGAREFNVRR
jgi:hypothetical protein